jgi:SEL1 protein
MRSSAVFLLLLLQATLGTATNAQHYLHQQKEYQAKQTKQNDAGSTVNADVVADQGEPVVPQPGAELVDAAFVELGRIPRSSYIRRRKRSGVIGTLIDYALLAIPTGPVSAPSVETPSSMNSHLSSAMDLLQQAAQQNNSDAIYLIADFNFFGNYSHPRNLQVAFDHYQQLAVDFGNTTAQYMLGVYYSNGLGDVVPRDQAKALLYYTFAAIRGDTRAEMATGYRHHAGIGATKSCEIASRYYKRVADKAIKWYRSGPPGGRTWIQQAWRIPDDDGGIYGEGASASSAGLNALRLGVGSDAHAAIGDVIEYLDLMSQKGDSKASLNLGRIYHDGERGLERDYELAKKYFFMVALKYWKKDGHLVENHKPGIEKTASKAAGYIGRMYLRGDGVTQSFERARLWFDRGIMHGDPQSQYGLGLMLLNGYGGKENIRKAMDLMRASSEQGYHHAQVQMGRLYLDQGGPDDVRVANNYFELAAQHGNIEAFYHLAELTHFGVGREKLCTQSLIYYKIVAEKAEPLLSSWADATDAFRARDLDSALLHYLLAAEQGYEKAQTNVAHLLDPARSRLPLSKVLGPPKPKSPLLDNPALALVYWTRSSRQANIDSLVKVGDYYYYGIGTEADVGKAVQCYTSASDYSQSAQALFNMGWMHENGVGLPQDFHLAKRKYDQALEINDEAYLPVTLSLLKLRVRSAWNSFTHGPIHSIQDEPKQGQDWSLSEWIANFFQDDGYEYDDGVDYYDEDVYEGHEDGDFDDAGVVESLLIIGITVSLVFLLWWRQRMQQAHAQAEDARRQQQGLPPRQGQGAGVDGGDGGFQPWAAGGIGL